MKIPRSHQIIFLIACSMLFLSPVCAESIQIDPSSITLPQGTTATVSLTLNDVSSGLAGYDLAVRFSNPVVAEISDVVYPSWAVMNDTTRKADGSVRMSGIDMSRQVEPGTTSIPLATLKITGITGGSSSLLIESVYMDADGGSIITPTIPTGTITVPGTSGSSTGGGSGGGGGSSSYVAQSHTSATPSPSPTTTQPESTPTQTPLPDKVTSIPSTTQPAEQPQTEATATTEMPDGYGDVPFSWIVGGIVLVGALIVGTFVAMKWDRDHE
ncbi:MAG: hypothetical protein A4E40_01430 [Methanoregulaceae archaeon PtaU1.Bin059]|jgi:cell division septation protein DedD|nr:MAG: hypothetical protein A4E40_01430 [Methanoregulaceae archaeon PtaU1.Bin059]